MPRTCDRPGRFRPCCAPPSSAPPRTITHGSSARLRSPGGFTAGQAKAGASHGALLPSAYSGGAALVRMCRIPNDPTSTFGGREADRCETDSSAFIESATSLWFFAWPMNPDKRDLVSSPHRLSIRKCPLAARRGGTFAGMFLVVGRRTSPAIARQICAAWGPVSCGPSAPGI